MFILLLLLILSLSCFSLIESFPFTISTVGEGGDLEALDKEEDVIAPTPANRATGRILEATEADDDDDEDFETISEVGGDIIEGRVYSNEGKVALPYFYNIMTHEPKGGEGARSKHLHLFVHGLSGSSDTDFTAHCSPNSKQIVLTFQRSDDARDAHYGPQGRREVVRDSYIRKTINMALADFTKNFSVFPEQTQIIYVPVILEHIEEVCSNLTFLPDNGDYGPFNGIYVRAKVRWTDNRSVLQKSKVTKTMMSPDRERGNSSFYEDDDINEVIGSPGARISNYPQDPRHFVAPRFQQADAPSSRNALYAGRRADPNIYDHDDHDLRRRQHDRNHAYHQQMSSGSLSASGMNRMQGAGGSGTINDGESALVDRMSALLKEEDLVRLLSMVKLQGQQEEDHAPDQAREGAATATASAPPNLIRVTRVAKKSAKGKGGLPFLSPDQTAPTAASTLAGINNDQEIDEFHDIDEDEEPYLPNRTPQQEF